MKLAEVSTEKPNTVRVYLDFNEGELETLASAPYDYHAKVINNLGAAAFEGVPGMGPLEVVYAGEKARKIIDAGPEALQNLGRKTLEGMCKIWGSMPEA